jgi:hypothetical protein
LADIGAVQTLGGFITTTPRHGCGKRCGETTTASLTGKKKTILFNVQYFSINTIHYIYSSYVHSLYRTANLPHSSLLSPYLPMYSMRRYCYLLSNGGTEPAILLVDNCPAHIPLPEAKPWKSGNLSGYKLSNVLVLFFKSHCTSKIQPLDAGCIQSAKANYRKRHMSWILDQISDMGDGTPPEIRCTLRYA